MNYLKFPLVVLLAIGLAGPLSFVATTQVAAQEQSTALERGYRTGYSDGYTAGFRDVTERAPRDYQNKEDYKRGDRSYSDTWGPIADYRDGYQQGFETGYAAGYERAQFNSNVPVGLKKRSDTTLGGNGSGDAVDNSNTTVATSNTDVPVNTQTGAIAIPRNTILAIELLTPISTDVNHRGDRFQARVTEPAQYEGYIVEGRVAELKRPGKVKGVAQLQLAFDQIRSTDHQTAALRAELLEITPMGGDNPEIDSEGGVKGRDSTKDDVAKVGAASGIGAIIGTIAGGGKGAAIGAIIGGGAGTAGVMTQRGKDLRLERGQQLKIRTSADTGTQ
jgi:hypothetical protein